VRARPVKRLDPSRTVTENAARIVRTRLAELRSFDPVVRDPDQVVALHDMRIAAKRLRYVLEILGESLGPAGGRGEKAAKEIQEILGEIHDCDVLVPRVEAFAADLREQDAVAIAQHGAGDADAVPGVVHTAPNAVSYRGLATLEAGVVARRRVLYRHFLERWDELDTGDLTTLADAVPPLD
jgi:hypothetical protein